MKQTIRSNSYSLYCSLRRPTRVRFRFLPTTNNLWLGGAKASSSVTGIIGRPHRNPQHVHITCVEFFNGANQRFAQAALAIHNLLLPCSSRTTRLEQLTKLGSGCFYHVGKGRIRIPRGFCCPELGSVVHQQQMKRLDDSLGMHDV